jgi:putative transposase
VVRQNPMAPDSTRPQRCERSRLCWINGRHIPPRHSAPDRSREATPQQLRESFPDDATARFLLHDGDATFDAVFGRTVEAFGLTSVRTSPRSPWQNPYVERVIGSIRRECLDHVIVFNERHLRRVLRTYVTYYQRSRTHLALGKDTPEGRAIDPAASGRIVARPEVGGLHHRYERQAA